MHMCTSVFLPFAAILIELEGEMDNHSHELEINLGGGSLSNINSWTSVVKWLSLLEIGGGDFKQTPQATSS
jgi:hypothetical protein